MPDIERAKILDLSKKLVLQSDVLSTIIPENTLCHVVEPNFSEPVVVVRDYDISDQLTWMGSQSKHLFVTRNILSAEFIDGVYILLHTVGKFLLHALQCLLVSLSLIVFLIKMLKVFGVHFIAQK